MILFPDQKVPKKKKNQAFIHNRSRSSWVWNIDSLMHIPGVSHFIWWYPNWIIEILKQLWVTRGSLCTCGSCELLSPHPSIPQWASKIFLQVIIPPTNYPWGWCHSPSPWINFVIKNSIWFSPRLGHRIHTSLNGQYQFTTAPRLPTLEVWGGVCPEGICNHEPNYLQCGGVHPKTDKKGIHLLSYFDGSPIGHYKA